ncbi:MAG: hypothetical protein ACOCNS_07250, partial [Bacteroidales bacterium]
RLHENFLVYLFTKNRFDIIAFFMASSSRCCAANRLISAKLWINTIKRKLSCAEKGDYLIRLSYTCRAGGTREMQKLARLQRRARRRAGIKCRFFCACLRRKAAYCKIFN